MTTHTNPRFTPPDAAALGPEPGWRDVDSSRFPRGVGRPFFSGDPDGDRIRLRYYLRDDGSVAGRVWFGPGAEGPPAHAHGGAMATALDEAMGLACWMAGRKVVAVRLQVDLRDMLPLGTVATVLASIDRVEGRKTAARGQLLGAAGEVYAEAQGLFVAPTRQRIAAVTERWEGLQGD